MNRSSQRGKIRQFLWCMAPSVVILALQNAAVVFGSQVYVVWMFWQAHGDIDGFGERFSEGLTSAGFLMSVSLGYAAVGILIFAVWYRSLKRKLGLRTDKDSLRGYPPYLFAGILLFAAAAQYVCEYLVVILAKLQPDWLAWYEELIQSLNLSGQNADILVIAYTVFFGPVCEELCFRGLTFQLAGRILSPSMTNLIQALLFGGMHANPLQSAYAFVFGWLLGQIYLETENLAVTILIHILFNGAGMCLTQFIGVGTTPATFFGILFASLSLAYCGFLLIRKAASVKSFEA